ncbi:MAG: hypothetical protein M1833_003199 [Piccolia ochrophora]|nr:MAG: hypothetical protein M1833_003199 [Piccolia ochrophora]
MSSGQNPYRMHFLDLFGAGPTRNRRHSSVPKSSAATPLLPPGPPPPFLLPGQLPAPPAEAATIAPVSAPAPTTPTGDALDSTPAAAAPMTSTDAAPATAAVQPVNSAAATAGTSQPAASAPNAPEDPTFSAEEDAQLLKLRDEDKIKNWQLVAEKMPKFKTGQLRKRYNALKKAAGGGENKSSKDKKGKTAVNEAAGTLPVVSTPAAVESTLPYNVYDHDDDDDRSTDTDVAIDPGYETFIRLPRAAAQAAAAQGVPNTGANDRWTNQEEAILRGIWERYTNNWWLFIASRFFDKTGVRVSAEAVQELIEGS